MSASAIRRLGLVSFALTLALLVGGEVLNAIVPHPSIFAFFRFYAVAFAFALVGVILMVRRPTNPVAWLASVIGLLSAMYDASHSYGVFNPSAQWAVSFGAWGFLPPEMLIAGVLPVVFPTGRLPSSRWRPVLWLAALGLGTGMIVGLSGWRPTQVNAHPAPILPMLFAITQLAFFLCLILGPTSMVVRYRKAGLEERLQLKWFLNAVLTVIALVLGATVATAFFNASPFNVPVLDTLIHLSFVAIPISIGIAVLKYRLYDIDLVINKTILFTTMALFIGGVYVAVTVGLGALIGTAGERNVVFSIVATALVAIAFGPVRERVQRLANRLVYGKRATPYEVMADFGERMAGAVSIDDVLPRMAEAAGRGIGAIRTRITMLLADGRRIVVDWPASIAGPPFDRVFPISHGGRVVGDIAVSKPADAPLNPAEIKLLMDLAGQAGLAVHNARLAIELQASLDRLSRQTEELRTSRQRIVSAQDEERRRLEQAIREGVEQQLATIEEQIDLAEKGLDKDGSASVKLLESIVVRGSRTLEDLRDLARALYPPLLRDQGLSAALRAQAAKVNHAVRIDGDGIGRFPAEVEGAVYFCCAEALRSSQGPADIRLLVRENILEFCVDAAALALDGRLQDMEDRVEALGGCLTLDHRQLTGRIPVGVLEPVA